MRADDPLSLHFRLDEDHRRALARLHIKSVADLLYHIPTRYENISSIKTIASLSKGDEAVVYGTVRKLQTRKSWKSRVPISEGVIEDVTGSMKVMWFHQPYIAKMIHEGASVKLSGSVSGNEKGLYLANPAIERSTTMPTDAHESLFGEGHGSASFFPVYPETKGITSRWIYHAIQKILRTDIFETWHEPLPDYIVKRYHLPTLKSALIWVHTPQKESDTVSAKKRFAFEEVFYIQLAKQRIRADNALLPAKKITIDQQALARFVADLPFQPTEAQQKAIRDICTDFDRGYPMSRLLEGDVGSGKTAVAAATTYLVATSVPPNRKSGTLQVAYMVPTEILAKQHFESFISYFKKHQIPIALITGNECRKFPSKINKDAWTSISRSQLLKWVANGEIPVVIGTHALIQKSVKFRELAYVIIDEQHRFGTTQRQSLVRKDAYMPHLLSMTATPIPRTLALTIYGDLDLTLLDQMPHGRKPIITEIVVPSGREKVYDKVKQEIAAGRQVYVICPRIDEPDPSKEMALQAKSVTEEAKRLKKKVFQDQEIAILHSKMKPAEKEKVMQRFLSHEIDILVATSVVEVGVNVPNATIILIEGAERFGLSQLHQLRGRVIRSNHQAYCYAFTETKADTSIARLKALKSAKNGFELAEYDLALRGAGELSGMRQWGVSDLAMEALKNIKMVEAARKEAATLVVENRTLTHYPELQSRVERVHIETHFE